MPKPRTLTFAEGVAVPDGRITLFAEPVAGMRYSLGLDSAVGIPDRDLDAGVMLDGRREQVATLHGRWQSGFADRIKDLVDHFGGPSKVFLVPEFTDHGMAVWRELYDSGYSWIYAHREEKTKGRITRDILGHVPRQWDITVQWLQAAIAGGKGPVVRDAELHGQLCKFGFRPRSKTTPYDEATRDAHLTWGAPDGEHDDLVRALALANAGLEWLPRFEPPKPVLPPESIGALLGWDKPDVPETKSRWR